MLIYAVYNGGKPLFDCQGDIVTYKRHVEKVMMYSPACIHSHGGMFGTFCFNLLRLSIRRIRQKFQYVRQRKKEELFDRNNIL